MVTREIFASPAVVASIIAAFASAIAAPCGSYSFALTAHTATPSCPPHSFVATASATAAGCASAAVAAAAAIAVNAVAVADAAANRPTHLLCPLLLLPCYCCVHGYAVAATVVAAAAAAPIVVPVSIATSVVAASLLLLLLLLPVLPHITHLPATPPLDPRPPARVDYHLRMRMS